MKIYPIIPKTVFDMTLVTRVFKLKNDKRGFFRRVCV